MRVPAIAEFSAEKTFGTEKSSVGICYLGDSFRRYFLGKTEWDIPATDLVAHTLTGNTVDAPILAELGYYRAETALAHLWYLLSLQPNGRSGLLLTNGRANIFYVRNTDGKLWAVYASWGVDHGDWKVNADPTDDPYGWRTGSQVVSRK